MSIEKTLQERGDCYGSFVDHAAIAQQLQDVMRSVPGWALLENDQKQALTVIADKVARMLNGKPEYRDNWHDIVGYAKLVDDRMLRDELEVEEFNVLESAGKARSIVPNQFQWVAWEGGECPVGGHTVVEIEHRSGNKSLGHAIAANWHHDASLGLLCNGDDIVRYRVTK